jgi:peptide/nickel transport system substrate-binding protein
MKRNLALRALATAAATSLLAGAFSVGALAPAQAATKTTVTLLSAGDITSLNPSTKGNNTTYNNLSTSLTGFGFSYYNSDAELVMNKKFGSMKILKNTAKDFQLQYTVAPGQTWSDGTKIDAVDLLLTHVISSSKYSKAAGLGDPKDATKKPSFDSLGYGGAYDDNVVGEPKLSNGNMTLTVKYAKPLPDWELLAPGASPVHALSLMADGKKGLQSASVNAAAKAKFLKDFTSKNSANLKKIGAVWTTGYNVNKVDKDTNPLLLISNGGFIISKYTFGDSMTLVRNPRYSSGPAMATKNPIKTVVIKVINNNTAQTQALRNGDIDILYNTNPGVTDKVALAAMPNVKTSINVGGSYSIFHLRTDTAFGFDDQYTGPFAGNSQRAKDLRKAYLLATPREQMVSTLIAPVKSDATSMNTQFVFQGTPAYKTITDGSGVSVFTKGTQAERTAQALKLVQKYYPAASATNPVVPIKFLTSDVPLRVQQGALTKAETAKAGFNTEIVLFQSIFANDINYSSKYDVVVHGFSINSLSQSASTDTYKTDGVNNAWGWSDSALDAILKSLESEILTPKEITAKRVAADKIIIANAWGLPLYAGPIITAYNKDLKNIKPAPVGNNITWNYFQWSY